MKMNTHIITTTLTNTSMTMIASTSMSTNLITITTMMRDMDMSTRVGPVNTFGSV